MSNIYFAENSTHNRPKCMQSPFLNKYFEWCLNILVFIPIYKFSYDWSCIHSFVCKIDAYLFKQIICFPSACDRYITVKITDMNYAPVFILNKQIKHLNLIIILILMKHINEFLLNIIVHQRKMLRC